MSVFWCVYVISRFYKLSVVLFISNSIVANLTINLLFITLCLTTIFGERYLVIRYPTRVIERITHFGDPDFGEGYFVIRYSTCVIERITLKSIQDVMRCQLSSFNNKICRYCIGPHHQSMWNKVGIAITISICAFSKERLHDYCNGPHHQSMWNKVVE